MTLIITPFHLYLAFGLAYLCYSSSKSIKQTSSNFLVSLTLASFLIFSNHWVLLFGLNTIVVLISFLFLGISPYLSKYLGLETEIGVDTEVLGWKDRLKSVFYSLYYDPKYMRCIGFWGEPFPTEWPKLPTGSFWKFYPWYAFLCLLFYILGTAFYFLLFSLGVFYLAILCGCYGILFP